MILVKQLVTSMRYALGDMQGAAVSDFELVEAINSAVWLLYSRFAEQYVSVGLKKITLVVDESGKTLLPPDFIKIHQVTMGDEGRVDPATYPIMDETEYRIVGDTIYIKEGVYGFEYYYAPARVSALADFLDAPQSISVYIVSIAVASYKDDLVKAMQVIEVCVSSLAAREVSHFENTGPVEIFGGKL